MKDFLQVFVQPENHMLLLKLKRLPIGLPFHVILTYCCMRLEYEYFSSLANIKNKNVKTVLEDIYSAPLQSD